MCKWQLWKINSSCVEGAAVIVVVVVCITQSGRKYSKNKVGCWRLLFLLLYTDRMWERKCDGNKVLMHFINRIEQREVDFPHFPPVRVSGVVRVKYGGIG